MGRSIYTFNKKFELIAGLRYDNESKNYLYRREYEKEGIGTIVTLPDTSATANFNAVSPSLASIFMQRQTILFLQHTAPWL
jgi:outer membrane receptor protein involved in Fe transport